APPAGGPRGRRRSARAQPCRRGVPGADEPGAAGLPALPGPPVRRHRGRRRARRFRRHDASRLRLRLPELPVVQRAVRLGLLLPRPDRPRRQRPEARGRRPGVRRARGCRRGVRPARARGEPPPAEPGVAGLPHPPRVRRGGPARRRGAPRDAAHEGGADPAHIVLRSPL
ncbi:MAG: hypothetical protein AVDCRST_MAG24-77, partial [uncultured Nocardioidaceae bacterium]